MERGSEELAAAAVKVLWGGLTTPHGEPILHAFAGWFERQERTSYAHTLRQFRWDSLTSPYLDKTEEEWHRRLHDVLRSAADEHAATEVVSLMARFQQAGSTGPATVDGPPVTGDHIDFRGGTFPGQVIAKQYNYGPQSGAGLPGPHSWPTLEDVDPVTLGVRQTRRPGDESGLPFYVTRDVDEALRGWHERDGLLLISGDALSGKSRTAWAAMIRHLKPHTRVYAPPRGTDLRALPALLRGHQGPYVLWLDELEGHLGDRGLDLGLLDELNRLGVPVVATMSDEEYEEHRFGGGPASRLLGRIQLVRLSSRWSEAELERLAAVTDDARLVDALHWRGGTGVTQYLAIGPELWELWHRAVYSNSRHPRGHLVVRAAIDLVRCGVTGDIPRELLEAASGCYGPGYVAGRPERESLDDALTWAAERRHGVTGLLVRGRSDGTWRPYGSLVADVLRDPSSAPVPLAVWRCALDGTRHDTVVHRGVRRTADAFFTPEAEAGDHEAMHMLGLLAEAAEDEATALGWFRKAVDAGMEEPAGRVGELLLARGQAEDALPYLRAAAERNPDGREGRRLGQAHLVLAEHWLGKAASGGDEEALLQLGDLLLGRGDLDDAADCYLTAEAHGYVPAARSSGTLALLNGEQETAEVFLARAVDAGDEQAAQILRSLMRPPQTLEDAEGYFQDPLESKAYPLDPTHHGAVLEKKGLPDAAREHYEKGYERGDSYGAYRLAALLHAQGNAEEATLWYRKAADMGHPAAKKALAGMAENPATVKE